MKKLSFTDLKVGKIYYSGGGIYYIYRGYYGACDILEFSEIEIDEHGNAFPSGEIVRFTPREVHDQLIAVEGY